MSQDDAEHNDESTSTDDSEWSRPDTSERPSQDDIDTEELAKEYEKLEEWEEELEKEAQRLEQRERGLDGQAEELNEREAELEQRGSELDERRDRIAEMRDELQAREEDLDQRDQDLDERESVIETKEAELEEYAEELKEKEQTLREYVEREVHELEDDIITNVQGAVSTAMDEFTENEGRLGVVGGIVLGLFGVVLVAGGIAFAVGTAGDLSAIPSVADDSAANYGVGGLLAFLGLVVNLAAVTATSSR